MKWKMQRSNAMVEHGSLEDGGDLLPALARGDGSGPGPLARIAVRLRGDYAGAHRVLTAAAGMAGPPELADAALQELRRAQPNISLAWITNQVPIQQDADREHYLEGFRRAGLD